MVCSLCARRKKQFYLSLDVSSANGRASLRSKISPLEGDKTRISINLHPPSRSRIQAIGILHHIFVQRLHTRICTRRPSCWPPQRARCPEKNKIFLFFIFTLIRFSAFIFFVCVMQTPACIGCHSTSPRGRNLAARGNIRLCARRSSSCAALCSS